MTFFGRPQLYKVLQRKLHPFRFKRKRPASGKLLKDYVFFWCLQNDNSLLGGGLLAGRGGAGSVVAAERELVTGP